MKARLGFSLYLKIRPGEGVLSQECIIAMIEFEIYQMVRRVESFEEPFAKSSCRVVARRLMSYELVHEF